MSFVAKTISRVILSVVSIVALFGLTAQGETGGNGYANIESTVLSGLTVYMPRIDKMSAGAPADAIIPIPAHGAYTGVYLDHYDDVAGQVAQYESQTGKRIAIGLIYQDWSFGFWPEGVQPIVDRGITALLSWAPDATGASILDEIIAGEWDAYIAEWAGEAKKVQSPILLRFAWEMNGNWQSWSGTLNGGGETTGYGDPGRPDGPERFIDAWIHVHDIFESEGCDNIAWVYCPNADSVPAETWNSVASYYPGDDYVDWVALDGYNWGETQDWSHWMTFEEIFGSAIEDLTEIVEKPVMIAETASAEDAQVVGRKADWITGTYNQIQNQYPEIKAIVWFNLDKETDWRIDSSSASLEAYTQAVSGAYYLDHIEQ